MACLDDGVFLDAFAFNRWKISGAAHLAISFVMTVAAFMTEKSTKKGQAGGGLPWME